MYTVTELHTVVQGYLGDPNITIDRVREAVWATLAAITPQVPKRAKVDYTDADVASDGTLLLPSDFHRFAAAFDVNKVAYRPLKLEHLDEMPENVPRLLFFPEGKVLPLKTPAWPLTLYYYAAWHLPAKDGSEDDVAIDLPDKLQQALLYGVLAHSLAPDAVSAAQLRQFMTRMDAGTPEHNPVHRQVEFYLKLFELELGRHADTVYQVGGDLYEV